MKINHHKGFTLVEVMIAMVVFSLLMLLVSSAMSSSTRFWQRSSNKIDNKITEYIHWDKFAKAVSKMAPYGVSINRSAKLYQFFQGSEQSLTFVSNVGLNQQEPAIIHLSLESSDSGDDIMIAEIPLKELMLKDLNQLREVEWNKRVLKSDISQFSLSYFGAPTLKISETNQFVTTRNKDTRWFSEYQGQETKLLPQKISVKWQEYKHGETVDVEFILPIIIDDKRRFLIIDQEEV